MVPSLSLQRVVQKRDRNLSCESCASGKILQTFEELSDKLLETALATAAICFETWRHTTFAARAAVVAKAAAIMRARNDEFARWQRSESTNTGSTKSSSYDLRRVVRSQS